MWKKKESLEKIKKLSEDFIQEMGKESLNYEEMEVILKKIENEYGDICKK